MSILSPKTIATFCILGRLLQYTSVLFFKKFVSNFAINTKYKYRK